MNFSEDKTVKIKEALSLSKSGKYREAYEIFSQYANDSFDSENSLYMKGYRILYLLYFYIFRICALRLKHFSDSLEIANSLISNNPYFSKVSLIVGNLIFIIL